MTDPVENVKEILSTFSRSWSNPMSKVIWLYCWKVAASLKVEQTRGCQSHQGNSTGFNVVTVMLETGLGEEA